MEDDAQRSSRDTRPDVRLLKYLCIVGLVLFALDGARAWKTGEFAFGTRWSGAAGALLGTVGLVGTVQAASSSEDQIVRRNLVLLGVAFGVAVASGIFYWLSR